MANNKQNLTPKQKLWLKNYCEYGSGTFGNATKAALKAYSLNPDTQYDSAKQIGWENLTKLDLQINELMEEMGLTDIKLLSKLIELLEAQKPYGKDGFMHSDNIVQGKALELAFKLKNRLNRKIEYQPPQSRSPIIISEIKPRAIKTETANDYL